MRKSWFRAALGLVVGGCLMIGCATTAPAATSTTPPRVLSAAEQKKRAYDDDLQLANAVLAATNAAIAASSCP